MNLVVLIGNLTADPEIRFLPSGAQLARLRMAVNERWTNKDTGQKQEKVHWIICNAFGRTAEVCGKFLKKGMKICVRGSLDYREWVDSKDGNKRSIIEVKVQELEMLTPKRDMPATGPVPQQGGAPGFDPSAVSDPFAAGDYGDLDTPSDDNIPF